LWECEIRERFKVQDSRWTMIGKKRFKVQDSRFKVDNDGEKRFKVQGARGDKTVRRAP
jgi:hypothetical protein